MCVVAPVVGGGTASAQGAKRGLRVHMSIRWISVFAWLALMSVVWAVFTPSVLPWSGLVWVGVLGFLTLSAALTLAMRSSRSVAQVIADTEGAPARVAIPVFGPVDRTQRKGLR